MAKAAAINLSDTFSPPPQTHVITPPSTYGDFLPSLPSTAGPGPGSASGRLSGTVKERASSASSYTSKRQSGPIKSVPMQSPSPHNNDGPPGGGGGGGGQQNAKLPPLMHGAGYPPSTGPSTARTGSPPSAASQQGGDRQHQHQHQQQQLHHGGERQQQQQQLGETIQPFTQHPSMLPGPTPASHPYQPKRKPPSAFMRKNPMRQQLELGPNPRNTTSAGSARTYGAQLDERTEYGSQFPNESQAQQFAEEVMAAAEAAISTSGRQQQLWGGGDGGGGGGAFGGFLATPPWGVSSVSDLEALDSILDQLVVVDARMRKALLQGPLISFETVVPEHIMAAAAAGGRMGGQQQQQPPQDDKDRTFLTSVKGDGEVEGGGEGEGLRSDAVAMPPPPPSPVEQASAVATAANARQALHPAAAAEEEEEEQQMGMEPRDSALFPASIPNPGMHPTFTRAYLASKMAVKPQHLPPPPPATAEHLLRSRPPPFIAAPSYDQLCSQIRDVQRQYTCGTARPAGQAGAAAGAGAAGAAAGASGGAAAAAGGPTSNQYIAGLDGPTLDEVVAHQELPISLERVRPTFVALKQKAIRSPSPRRRPGSPGRFGQGLAGGEGPVGEGAMVAGRML